MENALTFPCHLPADPLGIEYGLEYLTRIRAGRDSTITTDFLFHSAKNGREIDCLGMGEKSMALLLEVSPFVLAYRCQYLLLLADARERIDKYITGIVEGKPIIMRRDVISLDVLVTARRYVSCQPGVTLTQPDYFVLSHKLKTDLRKKGVKKRLELERNESEQAGYKHIVFSRNKILDECGQSAKQIMLWGKGCEFDSCLSLAQQVGEMFYETYNNEILDQFLMRASHRLKAAIDDIYRYFSAAINFGYLFVDLSFPVRAEYPVQLFSPKDAVPPWISFSGKVNSSLEY